jgi:hypothetical protein
MLLWEGEESAHPVKSPLYFQVPTFSFFLDIIGIYPYSYFIAKM